MSVYITVATFTLPSELAVAKTKLESEGIESRVLNELTIQSHNFLSNAIGGVQLQVLESDFKLAYSILAEGGFIQMETPKKSIIQKKLESPIAQKRVKYALVVFVTLSILIVIIGISTTSRPIISEVLVSDEWCLEYVIANELKYHPKTLAPGISFSYAYRCNEFLRFTKDGNIEIPGFGTRALKGKWQVLNDQIVLSQMDTTNSIFEGTYSYELYASKLFLYSDYLEFVCTRIATTK